VSVVLHVTTKSPTVKESKLTSRIRLIPLLRPLEPDECAHFPKFYFRKDLLKFSRATIHSTSRSCHYVRCHHGIKCLQSAAEADRIQIRGIPGNTRLLNKQLRIDENAIWPTSSPNLIGTT
jgi:hypothetical protein